MKNEIGACKYKVSGALLAIAGSPWSSLAIAGGRRRLLTSDRRLSQVIAGRQITDGRWWLLASDCWSQRSPCTTTRRHHCLARPLPHPYSQRPTQAFLQQRIACVLAFLE